MQFVNLTVLIALAPSSCRTPPATNVPLALFWLIVQFEKLAALPSRSTPPALSDSLLTIRQLSKTVSMAESPLPNTADTPPPTCGAVRSLPVLFRLIVVCFKSEGVPISPPSDSMRTPPPLAPAKLDEMSQDSMVSDEPSQ